MDRKVLALVGNPNVGKTVLFNSLCNTSERVGNWHGVTTEKKINSVKYGDSIVDIVDLPGCYNLSGYSLEEKETARFLEYKNCSVINICDMRFLERNLYLTMLLLEKGKSVILFLNDYAKYSGKIDVAKLGELLGVEILSTTAGSVKLKQLLAKEFRSAKPQYYDEKFEKLDAEEKIKIRYAYIEKLLKNCSYTTQKPKVDLDNIFLGKFGIIIFCLLCGAMFYICFGGVGSFLSNLLQEFLQVFIFNPIHNFLSKNCSEVITSLICDGILSAGVGLISFLPQIILVSLFINLLQDSGYLSRIAFLFEGVLSKIGLSGKAIFSILISFGCNTTAILTTNNQEDKVSKAKLALFLPFICCSAKLPIFVIFTQILVDGYGFILTILLYVIAFFVGLAIMSIINKIVKNNESYSFLLEMGEYKLPNLKNALKDCLLTAKSFLTKIGTTIFVANIIVWFLQSFDFSFKLNSDKSMLQSISESISFIFAPIGLDNYGIVSALIIGVMAKELILTTLALVNGIGVSGLSLLLGGGLVTSFSPLTLFIFLVFISLYSPCISFLIGVKKSFGKKFAIFSCLGMSLLAYVVCMIIYLFGSLFIYSKELFVWGLVGVAFLLAIIFLFKTKGKCRYCSNKNCSKCPK